MEEKLDGNEPGFVLILTVPFSEINGKSMPEIMIYLHSELGKMEDEIISGLTEDFFKAERPGLELGPSDIN